MLLQVSPICETELKKKNKEVLVIGRTCSCHKPVVPGNVEELAPPSTDNHSDIETKDERQRNKVREPLAVDCYMLKHSAQYNTVLSSSNMQVSNKCTMDQSMWQMAIKIDLENGNNSVNI